MGSNNNTGLIFNIQRFSVHDGPGVRSLVFMKGCPLRCVWCSNPESQNSCPEIAFSEERCIGFSTCGRCQEVCDKSAIILYEGKIRIDRSLCNNCGECARVCPAQALRLLGQYVSIEDITKLVEEDGAFYSRSGGGITVSGGEPLAQAEFVGELLKECRCRGIDTAIEITGFTEGEDVYKACRYANLIFYDIKHMDSDKHKTLTGASNILILENIKMVSGRLPTTPIIVRTPIIPNYNDSEVNIKATADFLIDIKSVQSYELLPYHAFGESKYKQLGRELQLSGLHPPSQECMDILSKITRKATYTNTN